MFTTQSVYIKPVMFSPVNSAPPLLSLVTTLDQGHLAVFLKKCQIFAPHISFNQKRSLRTATIFKFKKKTVLALTVTHWFVDVPEHYVVIKGQWNIFAD